MKRQFMTFLLCVSSGLLLANHWTPNISQFENYTSLTGVVQINGIEQQSTTFEVGAFCGGYDDEHCRSSEFLQYYGMPFNRCFIQLTIYGKAGDQFTFRLYDHETNQELDLTSPDPILFNSNNGYGNPVDPYVLNFTSSVLTFTNHSGNRWSTPTNWSSGALPQDTDDVLINGTCQLDMDATVASLTVTDGKSITVQEDKTLTVTSSLATTEVSQLVIKDGGRLVNSSTNVHATAMKNIVGYGNGDNPGGWYTIASPVASMVIAGSDFVNGEYDLYRYTEEQALWENYKANQFTFEPGRGYLYAKKEGGTLGFEGVLTTGDVAAPLSCSCSISGMCGWNLIGNPYMHDIAMGNDDSYAINTAGRLQDGYYSQSNSGAWVPHTTLEPIAPTTGILVKAVVADDDFKIKDIAAVPSKADADRLIQIAVSDGETCDLTYLVCGDGNDLDKMEHLDESIPMIYSIHNGEMRGISYIDNEMEPSPMPIGFKAGRVAAYTVSVSIHGNFDYLHLFDRLSGNDVDLLAESAYRFYGSPADDSDRFEILFSPSVGIDEDEAGSTFAYFTDGSVVVSGVDGEGLLEMFDVAGRRIVSHSVSSSPAVVAVLDCKSGVYVVRLCSGDGVKVQKIVVY